MKTNLVVNDTIVPLNPFTQRYIGNILKAITLSLGYEARKVNLCIDQDDLRLYADDQEVPIKKEFVKLIIESTIKGILSPLKGIFLLERILISSTE
ncbi:MAG: hypothetical protein GXO99_08850 [Nitrospirae bacterium]|nr:hypothetical protein [Nitrospirota bacterium]